MALVALVQPAAAQEPATTYIHAGRLLADPASGRVETNKTIVVTAGKVAEIRDGFVGEGKVVDLRDQFVMPGFIDSHVHLTFESSPTSRLDAVTKSTVDQAFDGVVFAKRTVRAGFTTVVDLGSDPQAINALRDATATGKVVGPRIIAAGGVAAHGGHGDVHGYRQEIIDLFRSPTLCSGADDCARAVRLAVQQGADVIKTASTGGVMSNTAAGLGQQMSDAELVAIVDTAHRLGRKVAAHAHGTDGVNAALRAGVDSVEHGTYLDAESIRLFKAKGSYLVPTLLAGDTVALRDLVPALIPELRQVMATEGTIDFYRTVTAECLLMCGSDAPTLFTGTLDALEGVLPNARRVELAGLNHGAAQDQAGDPRMLADQLQQFFS